MKLKPLLACMCLFVLSSPAFGASTADELFSMAEKLEKMEQWKMEDIWRIRDITGHVVKRTSIARLASDEQPDNKLVRRVEVDYDPREDRLTGVWLCFPKQGLGITLGDVVKRFGKCTKKGRRETYDNDSVRRFGYRTLIAYEYKRPGGGWLAFDFDDDATKQLRIIRVVP